MHSNHNTYHAFTTVSLVLLREVLSYSVISYARGKTLFREILKPKIILNFEIIAKRVAAACRHRQDSSRAYWLPCGNCSSLSREAPVTSDPMGHVPPKRVWPGSINIARQADFPSFSSPKRTRACCRHGKIRSTRSSLERTEVTLVTEYVLLREVLSYCVISYAMGNTV